MCLKCADLGHLASAKEVHREWVHRLESEVGSEGEGVLTAYLALAYYLLSHNPQNSNKPAGAPATAATGNPPGSAPADGAA